MKHHNVSDLSKHSPRPDQRGDGTAKLRELEKVKRVREQQLRAAQKNLKEVEEKAMQETTETTSEKTRSYTQKKLAPVELEAIERLVSTHGEQRVVSWLSGTPRARLAQHPMSWARGALRSIRDPKATHKSTLLDVAAELLTNFGKHHNGQRVEATPIPVEVTEVRSVVENRATQNEKAEIVQTAHPEEFDFQGSKIRMVIGTCTKTDEPMCVAKDLVEAVGATWSGHSLDHIPAQYRGMVSVSTPSGTQQMVCLSEPGMNMYLFRSDKPAALPWQRHLAEIVLPQIRKTGRYETPGAAPQLPPASIDYAAMGTAVGTAVADAVTRAVVTTIRELLPRRAPRKPKPNPAQQELPKTELRLVESPKEQVDEHRYTVARAKLMNNPRLWNIPKPGTVKDVKLMEELERMIEIYGMVSGLQSEKYSTAYDAIERWDPKLRDRKDETKIAYIRSQSAQYKREAYRLAYGALVTPYLKVA